MQSYRFNICLRVWELLYLYNLYHCVPCLLPFKVDAFTTTPLHGNPAAVMLLGRGSAVTATDTLLQAIAAENNLPETAFIQEIEVSCVLAPVNVLWRLVWSVVYDTLWFTTLVASFKNKSRNPASASTLVTGEFIPSMSSSKPI